MRRATGRMLAACVLALSLAACHETASGPSAALRGARNAAKARWDAAAATSYSFVAQRACECTADAVGPVRVTVSSGAIALVERIDAGAPVDPTLWFSVDGLFALIDRELQQSPGLLSVDYDATIGFPTRVSWGRIEVDAGAVITVSALASLPH